MTLDMRLFAQCRTCCEPMPGILSIKAREDCVGCGGEALNVNNQTPLSLEDLAAYIRKLRGKPMFHRTTPSPGKRRA